MPNATVRANAQAMPTLDRRAALSGFLAAAGATLAAPRSAKAADLDADLLALQGPIEAADREFEAALHIHSVAEETEFRLRPARPVKPAMALSQDVIEDFNRFMATNPLGKPSELTPYDEAVRQYKAECARIRADIGKDEICATVDAASEVVTGLQEQLAETPARTLAGLIFKARYAAAHDYDDLIMESLVDDLCRMAGEA